MSVEKEDPVIEDGKPVYTLTSCDPVNVVVPVCPVSDEDVDNAIWRAVHKKGGNMQDMADDGWIHQKFPEAHNIHELREIYKTQLERSHDPYVEWRKKKVCSDALCARLEQRLLREAINDARAKLAQIIEDQFKQNKMTMADYAKQINKTEEEILKWMDAQSVALAEQVTAFSVFAREREITVSNNEVADYLRSIAGNTPLKNLEEMIGRISLLGRYEEVRFDMLCKKVMHVVVEEAHCTYSSSEPFDKYDPIFGYSPIDFY